LALIMDFLPALHNRRLGNISMISGRASGT